MPQCTAKSKRTLVRCTANAMKGKTVCYHHGGKSQGGVLSPTYKGKGYSKFMPTRLADAYQQALNDPDLVSLSSDIALMDVRLGEVLAKLDTGEAGAIWDDLQDACREGSIDRIAGLVARGANEYRQWEDILPLIEQRRKLVESESKRTQVLNQNVPVEKNLLLMGVILNSLRTHAPREVQEAVANDLKALIY